MRQNDDTIQGYNEEDKVADRLRFQDRVRLRNRLYKRDYPFLNVERNGGVCRDEMFFLYDEDHVAEPLSFLVFV